MNYITIGTITKPHGVRGALGVKTDSDFKHERYRVGNTLYILCRGVRHAVTIRGHFEKGTVDVLSFEQFSSKEAVDPFRGCELQIDEATREPLEDDEYYFTDLIGLNVYVGTTKKGVVEAVRRYPQGEVLVIKREGENAALVPFSNRFVETVDEDKIVVIEMEGLL